MIIANKLRMFLTVPKNVLVIAIIAALGSAGASLYSSFFPIYVVQLGGSVVDLGIVLSVSYVVSSLAFYPAGVYADTHGRKPLLVLGYSLAIIGVAFYLLAPSWPWLIPGIVALSLGATVVDPAGSALVADSTTSEQRSTAYGLIRTFFAIPAIFVPFAAGLFLQSSGFRPLFLTAVTIFSIRVATVRLLVKETHLVDKLPDKRSIWGELRDFRSRLALFKENKGLASIATVGSLWVFLHGQVIPFYSLYAFDFVTKDTSSIGLMWSIMMLVNTLVGIPGGKIADKYGRKGIVVIGEGIATVNLVLLTFATNPGHLVIVGLLLGLAGIGEPAYYALVSEVIPKEKRGAAIGAMETITQLVGLPAPLVGALLWQTLGSRTPFYLAAALNIPTLIIFYATVPETRKISESKSVQLKS